MPSIKQSSDDAFSTFAHESTLSQLPLPSADRTLNQLQDSLRPLYFADGYYKPPMNAIKLQEFGHNIKGFLNSKLCNKLRLALEDYHNSNNCYLDNLHLDINNNSSRELENDVLPRNPFLLLEDDILPKVSQVDRSTVLVHAALRFISALKQRVLPPDRRGNDGVPLTMLPYEHLFGCTRCPVLVPGELENFDMNKPFFDSDLEFTYSSGEEDEDKDEDEDEDAPPNDSFTRHGVTIGKYSESKHLLVISRGQYYTIEVLDNDGNILLNAANLRSVLTYILEDSLGHQGSKAATALGSLTSHSFRSWKYARKRLERKFPDQLRMIDSALFVLVLDHSSTDDDSLATIGGGGELEIPRGSDDNDMLPSTRSLKRLFYGTSIIDDNGHQMGSCISRWYDKLQLVVSKDSDAAVIWDCFTCDGSAVLRFASEMYTESILRLAREVNLGDPQFSLWPTISFKSAITLSDREILELDPVKITNKIEWEFSDILNTHIHLSETKLADLISKYDTIRFSIPYGRRKAEIWGIKPDSMIQIALQIAHFTLYGKMVYACEPVSTRGFRNSRSCYVNVQSSDLLELCQGFISNSLDEIHKLNKFLETCKKYAQWVKETKAGNGFEKHFSALRYLFKFSEHYSISLNAEDRKIGAPIFENPILDPFLAPEILAANCGNASTTAFAITPANPNGFAVGYNIKDDCCDLTVTSQFRQGGRLMFMLNWVLSEISRMWKTADGKSLGNGATVRISPLVDKLYQMDNAFNHAQGTSDRAVRNYGFFDLHPHWESLNASETNSTSTSSTGISSLENSSKAPYTSPFKHSSTTQSVPTEREKYDTGFQIKQFASSEHLPHGLSEKSATNSFSRPTTGKRSNIIHSKFEIDFDRGMVGKKINSVFD